MSRASCTISSPTRRCRAPASTQAAFWPGFAAIVHDLAPKNRALLAKRDALQDADRRLAPRATARHPTSRPTRRSCSEIGYLLPEGPAFSGHHRQRRSGDRRDRRAAARRAGDERALCAERRQCPLGHALRRALRHRCHPRGRTAPSAATATIRCAAQKVIAWARAFLDEAAPLDGARWRDATGFAIDGGQARRSRSADWTRRRPARRRRSSPAIAATRPRPTPILLKNNGLHIEILIDRDSPIGTRRSGRHRRRRAGIGAHHDPGLRGFDRRGRRRGQGRWPTATGSA